MATRTAGTTSGTRSSRNSSAKPVAAAAKRATGPVVAGGAAIAGLAAGTALGAKLRASRRPHLLGLPMPRGAELKSGAKQAVRAGRWVTEMQSDVRAVRAQAAQSRRQSPIEVVLSALTSRRLPRHHE
jgi:hypothetical protein